MPNYVIIGDGPAGISAAVAIRTDDPNATITVLSADPNPHYYRAALTNYLLGQLRADELWGVPPDFYARHAIGRYYGQVVGVEPARNVVTLEGGQQVPYDTLLIAAGSTPVPLAVPGAALPGVLMFRTLQDARRIADLLPDVRQAVVVGGGTLGLEWVEGLRHQGLEVTYILREQQFMPRLLDATASDMVLRQLRGAGVNLVLGDEVVGIQAWQGWAGQVITRVGRQLPCQLVGAAIGVRPNIAFLSGSGVRTERGVLTDAQLRTSQANIFAAGDIAQVGEPRGQRHLPPSGLWQPARAQGRIAGRNMAATATGRGHLHEYDPGAPYVATRLYALDFVAIGDTQPANTATGAYPLSARTATSYRKLLLREGRLIGALLLGDRSNARAFKRLIDLAVDVKPIGARLLDAHFDLAAWTEQQAVARAPRRLSLTGLGRQSPGATTDDCAPAALGSLGVEPAVATAPRLPTTPAIRRPAQLTLAGRTYAVSGERPFTLGRAAECDLVLTDTSVSRRHAELLPRPDGYALRDLNSANGSWVGLARSEPDAPQLVQDGDLLRLGGVSVTFNLIEEGTVAPGESARDAAKLVGPFGTIALTKATTSLGRAADSDVPIDDRKASRLHAQILHTGTDDFYLRDMGSVNGTLVNGVRVFDAHPLRDGDVVGVGATTFTFQRNTPEGRPHPPQTGAELTIVQGSGAGSRHTLRDGDTTIGRDPGNMIALADSLATRRHAAITVAGEEVSVRDLGSSNGTWVNGARLTAAQRLRDGDTIDIGQTRFEFRRRVAAGQPVAVSGVVLGATVLLDPALEHADAAQPPAEPALTIVGGAQDGRRFPLTPRTTLVLGRDGQNAIPLKDERVSRRHAELSLGATGTAMLRDLGSSNGTLVNGRRIVDPHPLSDGDLVVVGDTTLRFTAR